MELASPPIVVLTFPLSFEVINSETVIVSPEAGAMQDNVDSPREPPPSPQFFASGTITRLKSQQILKFKVQSVTHEQVNYPSEELVEFPSLYKQKSGEPLYKWILMVR